MTKSFFLFYENCVSKSSRVLKAMSKYLFRGQIPIIILQKYHVMKPNQYHWAKSFIHISNQRFLLQSEDVITSLLGILHYTLNISRRRASSSQEFHLWTGTTVHVMEYGHYSSHQVTVWWGHLFVVILVYWISR